MGRFFVWACVFGLSIASSGVAEAASPLVSTATATAAVQKQYSHFLASSPGASVKGASVGDLMIAQFAGDSMCSAGKCYTTAYMKMPGGGVQQVLAVRAGAVGIASKGPVPELLIDGVLWDYAAGQGYIASVSSAGRPFVPNLVLHGASAKQVAGALGEGGWPIGVPALVSEVKPGGDAPATLVAVPDMTTASGQEACAVGRCPVALLVGHGGAWKVSAVTRGTGLLALLNTKHNGGSEIGVGKNQGFEAFGWSAEQTKWLPAYTTYRSEVTPAP